MAVMTRRGWLAASAILPAAGALTALRSKAEFSAPVSGRDVMRERYFPNVVLTTHEGKAVRFYDDLIKDKAVVINMMFAACVDPEHDTPANLNDYAKSYGVGPGWLFLTGKPDDIELLREKLGYVDPDPVVDGDKTRHSGMLRYGNEPLSLWASCQGGASPEWIAESISWVLPKTGG
jgi:protein SCO1/2